MREVIVTMRASGIMLHISSLPNRYGFGCFSKEAYDFVDFLSDSGFRYWQILPLNPTNESGSPFQSYSVFAGNPCFIDLTQVLTEKELLPLLNSSKNANSDAQNNFINAQKSCSKTSENCPNAQENCSCNSEQNSNNEVNLNNKSEQIFNDSKNIQAECEVATCNQIDFNKVYSERLALLKIVFERDFNKYDLTEFKKKNAFWLEDYAVFSVLKEKYNVPYWKFPTGLNSHDKKAIDEFKKNNQKQIDFYIFVQYLFFEQWQKLKEYANKKNVQIFGDIAFYPAGDSCDVWANKSEFCFDTRGNPKGVAGVPPDYFSEDGQLWGSPVYNKNEMKKNNYRFWAHRLEYAYNFFDMLRLDHFRGFEAFWVVDDYKSQNAKNGKWVKGLGLDFFNTLKNKKIPKLVAEDLGTITKEVNSLISNLGIAGMRVFQFAFDGNPKNSYFPHNYPDNCVAYIGTHDNNTFVGFLNSEADENSLKEIKNYLGQSEHATYNEILEMVFSVLLNSRAETVILTMQDILFLDEHYRMNTPGTVNGNWCFRLKPNYANENLKNYLLKLNISANRA